VHDHDYAFVPACRPWNSLEAEPAVSVLRSGDAQPMINRCLDCPAPECYNCLGGGKRNAPEGQLYLSDFFEF